MVPKSWWYTSFFGLIVVASLPVIGHLIRGDRKDRCDWDGLKIKPIYQVRLVELSGESHQFCCVQCANRWLEHRGGEAVRVFVTDEISGQEIESSEAHFVRSLVSTNQVTGNRQHVFQSAADALKHAEAAGGRELFGDEKPFSRYENMRIGNP